MGLGSAGRRGQRAPPDLEDILRRSQDRLKTIMPGGSMGGKGLSRPSFLAPSLIWLLTGFYTVRPNEVGINMIFGKYTGTTGEGLRYNLPYPIGRVVKPNVTAVNTDRSRLPLRRRRAGPLPRRDRRKPDADRRREHRRHRFRCASGRSMRRARRITSSTFRTPKAPSRPWPRAPCARSSAAATSRRS